MNDIKKDPFEEYIRQVEPGKKELGYAWYTAIGLQDIEIPESVGNKTQKHIRDLFEEFGYDKFFGRTEVMQLLTRLLKICVTKQYQALLFLHLFV